MIAAVDFAFLFARFTHFYGMAPEAVLKMRARLFWSMERNIDRIKAQGDLRSARVQQVSVSGDNAKQINRLLLDELGQVVQLKKDRVIAPEEGAIDRLKALAGR